MPKYWWCNTSDDRLNFHRLQGYENKIFDSDTLLCGCILVFMEDSADTLKG